MYPIQNYPVNQAQFPCAAQYPQPQAQVNAVKIDIINPQASGGQNGQVQSCQQPYAYNSMYSMPNVSQYYTPGAYPQPPMMLPQNQQYMLPQPQQPQLQPQQFQPIAQPQQQVAMQPVQNPNVIPATLPAQMQPVQPIQQVQPQLIQPQPIPMQPQNQTVPVQQPVAMPVPPVPVVPAPVMVVPPTPGAQPVVNAPVTQNVNVNPQALPNAVVDAQQVAPNDIKTIKPVEPVKPVETADANKGIDVKGILTALSSANTDEQTVAIQKIAEVAQTNPVASKALLNEQVFGQLVNIINADTSKLEGPKGGQPDPQNLSPLEKAEINKQFAVYTLAILQKNFREEINKEMKKNNLPDLAINDIPFIKEGIVNNLKDNPNPTIREACLGALNYLGRPEDKEVLKVLYDISAKHDASPAVKATAKDYLSKLPA